ncbi:MAG: hypothetical protein VXA09_03575, partial [Burkholderiaceae bacterium]
ISGYSAGEVPNAILLKGVSVRFGCQHGLRLTTKVKLARYYNALREILVPKERCGSADRR